MHAAPYELAFSHPPYAARHKMLAQAIRVMGWQNSVIMQPPHSSAEEDLLDYVSRDPYHPWALFISDHQLRTAISGVNNVFSSHGGLGYVAPDKQILTTLVDRLVARLPPIVSSLSTEGAPQLQSINIAHTLYAGWIYSIGAKRLTNEPLSFLTTNMLCDHALLQQRAIDIAIAKRMK